MTTSRKRMLRFAVLGLVGLVVSLPAATSRAHEPSTAIQAQAMAQMARVRAEKARALGGVGYKSGAVQRAETDEARYMAMAEEMTPAPATVPTPIADHYAAVADHYRAMGGGPAYKWRRVQQAEMQQERWARIESQAGSAYYPTPAVAEEPAPPVRPACETVSKPVVRTLACAQ